MVPPYDRPDLAGEFVEHAEYEDSSHVLETGDRYPNYCHPQPAKPSPGRGEDTIGRGQNRKHLAETRADPGPCYGRVSNETMVTSLSVMSAKRSNRRVSHVAHAHTVGQCYLYLVADRDGLHGAVQIPVHQLNHELGTNIPERKADSGAVSSDDIAAVSAYVGEHFYLLADGEPVGLDFSYSKLIEPSAGAYIVMNYVTTASASRPGTVTLEFDPLSESYGVTGLAMVLTRDGFGRYTMDSEQRLEFTSPSDRHSLDLAATSAMADVKATSRRAIKSLRIRFSS